MLKEWFEYLKLLLYRVLFGASALEGNAGRSSKTSQEMSDTQVSLVGSGSRQIEQESTEETTLSEVSKDLGHTKISEKSAEFKGTSNTSIVEENASKNVQSSCSVVQSESVSQSESRKVTSSAFSSSFSSEESEEYVIEG